jgi:hypothetical protein
LDSNHRNDKARPFIYGKSQLAAGQRNLNLSAGYRKYRIKVPEEAQCRDFNPRQQQSINTLVFDG